jgi:hypothetical protein
VDEPHIPQHVAPKRLLAFNLLYGVISQESVLFATTSARYSNATKEGEIIGKQTRAATLTPQYCMQE